MTKKRSVAGSPRRSMRLLKRDLEGNEDELRKAVELSLESYKLEQQQRDQCKQGSDLSHLDEVKVDVTKFSSNVFHRRKRRRQEEDEDPGVSQEGNLENDGGSVKSRTMEEIVEQTKHQKSEKSGNEDDTKSKDVPDDEPPARKKSKSSKSKRQKAAKSQTPSTKRKKKKDVVRTYFGYSPPGNLEATNGEVLVVEDEEHLHEIEENKPQLKRCGGVKFAYPCREDPEAVEIDESDLQYLGETEFVNDTVVDLYIKYIQLTQSLPVDKFHVFNSFFFKKLAQAVCDENYLESVGKLRKWTRGMDIFDKTYLLMPVHERLHWSLVVICFSGQKPGCHILHLDSMKTGHNSRALYDVVRRYLLTEWISHGGESKEFKNIREKKVKVPQQENEYDCGFFMLHYIQKFLLNAPAAFSEATIKDMYDWFSLTEASKLRAGIRQIVEGLFRKDGDEVKEGTIESVVINEDGNGEETQPQPQGEETLTASGEVPDKAGEVLDKAEEVPGEILAESKEADQPKELPGETKDIETSKGSTDSVEESICETAAEDQERTPAKIEQTPAKTEDQVQTPAKTEDQEQTPAEVEDQEQTPAKIEDQEQTDQTPPKIEDQEQTPAKIQDQEQTPAKVEDQEQTPAKTEDLAGQ